MVRDGFRRTAKLCEVYSTAEPKHYATIFKMGMRMYATKVKSSRAMRVAARLAGTTIDDIVNDEFSKFQVQSSNLQAGVTSMKAYHTSQFSTLSSQLSVAHRFAQIYSDLSK